LPSIVDGSSHLSPLFFAAANRGFAAAIFAAKIVVWLKFNQDTFCGGSGGGTANAISG
jgi:hypothetical protein